MCTIGAMSTTDAKVNQIFESNFLQMPSITMTYPLFEFILFSLYLDILLSINSKSSKCSHWKDAMCCRELWWVTCPLLYKDNGEIWFHWCHVWPYFFLCLQITRAYIYVLPSIPLLCVFSPLTHFLSYSLPYNLRTSCVQSFVILLSLSPRLSLTFSSSLPYTCQK